MDMDPMQQVSAWLEDGSPPREKRKAEEAPEAPEPKRPAAERDCPHANGTCRCKEERERQRWVAPDPPDGHAYCNAKVKYHKDFDIIEWAETYFKEDYPYLIVTHIKGKNEKKHWHVHGVPDFPRKVKNKPFLRVEHPLRVNGEKPISSKWFDKDPSNGFQYCVKPAECIGRCPVVHMHGLSEGDMYQIMQQSEESVQSFEEELEAAAEKAVVIAESPFVNHRRLHILTTKYYHAKDRKLHAGLAWKVRDWIAKWHPEGHEYIAEKYM